MNFRLLIVATSSLILMSACTKSEPTEPVVTKAVPVAVQQEQKPVEPPVLFPPTLDDGDYYFKARAQNDLSLCAKIANEPLRNDCTKELQKKS